jgi:dTDP-4-amino-4,6-dideoxygalactose transaminase
MEMPYAKHVYHLYVVQAEDRKIVRQHLLSAGIETGLHYPTPLHLQEAYSSLGYEKGTFPVTERLAGRIFSLPIYPDLTDEKIEQVASALVEALRCQTTLANY